MATYLYYVYYGNEPFKGWTTCSLFRQMAKRVSIAANSGSRRWRIIWWFVGIEWKVERRTRSNDRLLNVTWIRWITKDFGPPKNNWDPNLTRHMGPGTQIEKILMPSLLLFLKWNKNCQHAALKTCASWSVLYRLKANNTTGTKYYYL